MNKNKTKSQEKNILIPTDKSRSEFIEKFNKRNNSLNKRTTESNLNDRWNLLYNQGKVQKLKAETYRKQELEKRTKTEESECTFSPKFISKYKYKENSKNKNNESLDLLNRQNNWLQQRDLHLEGFKEEMNYKNIKECHFEPKIVKIIFFLIFSYRILLNF